MPTAVIKKPLRRQLPPKPSAVQPGLAKPTNDHPGLQKAVKYRIDLADGTALVAEGDHANVVYQYLMTCEKICASQQLVSFLAPGLVHVDSEGNEIKSLAASVAPLKK